MLYVLRGKIGVLIECSISMGKVAQALSLVHKGRSTHIGSSGDHSIYELVRRVI